MCHTYNTSLHPPPASLHPSHLLQVIKRDGGRGLIPLSYVQVAEEEEEDEGDVFSLAGRTDVTAPANTADGTTDFNSFLKG